MSGDRITTLDGLRGGAVMGILLMNIAAFAMPFAAYANPAAFGALSPANIAVWAVEFVLVDGKMRAIFSCLFGASLLLIADRAEAGGASAARIHYARMAVLLLIGLAHACLIWDGDILVLYALVGAIAFRFRSLEIERMLILAGLLLLAELVLFGLQYQGLWALAEAAARPGADPATLRAWRELLDTIGRPSERALAAELMLHWGPWAGMVADRAADEPGAVWAQLLFYGPETLGLMLLGMAGLRSGMLTGALPRAACLAMARRAYAIGLPPLASLAALLIAKGFPPLLTAAIGDFTLPLRWLIAGGHIALVAAWFAGPPSPLKARVAAAGRTALTNYLGTSLLMTALFDGWGLGLYGRVERWQLLGFVLLGWVLMLAWSKPWLDRFAYGPAEWLWRLLARRRIPAFRRKAIAS